MHINPVKVSFNGFAILFKVPSAHCVSFYSKYTLLSFFMHREREFRVIYRSSCHRLHTDYKYRVPIFLELPNFLPFAIAVAAAAKWCAGLFPGFPW